MYIWLQENTSLQFVCCSDTQRKFWNLVWAGGTGVIKLASAPLVVFSCDHWLATLESLVLEPFLYLSVWWITSANLGCIWLSSQSYSQLNPAGALSNSFSERSDSLLILWNELSGWELKKVASPDSVKWFSILILRVYARESKRTLSVIESLLSENQLPKRIKIRWSSTKQAHSRVCRYLSTSVGGMAQPML